MRRACLLLFIPIGSHSTQNESEMNGDRLVLDRSGPHGTVNMRVVLSDKPGPDTSRDWMLKAPMPPPHPKLVSEELRRKRLARRIKSIDTDVFSHVCDYVLSQCEIDDSVDVASLEKDLRKYFAETTVESTRAPHALQDA